MATGCTGAAAAPPPFTLTSTAAGWDGTSVAAGQVMAADRPSELDPLDGGLNLAFTPPVTEPQTYAMLLAALGVVGFVARHRRGTSVR